MSGAEEEESPGPSLPGNQNSSHRHRLHTTKGRRGHHFPLQEVGHSPMYGKERSYEEQGSECCRHWMAGRVGSGELHNKQRKKERGL